MEQGIDTVAEREAGNGQEATPRPGGLHGDDAIWQETNCYMDLWIELLYRWGLDPRAALAFTVTQDFEGDHFTFFKYPATDLELLHGTVVQEMAIYDTLEAHIVEQVRRGHTVLAEVDSFYLPDTRATAYRRGHVKTTVAIDRIDPIAQRLTYFHNLGHYTVDAEDYRGLLRLEPALRDNTLLLFPYVECVKRVRPPLTGRALSNAAAERMRRHLARLPEANPITRWREVFDDHVSTAVARGDAYFHHYGFNLPRQLGANFEMLAHGVTWLGEHGYRVPASILAGATSIATECKVLQFRLARAVARRRTDACTECLDTLEHAYAHVTQGLLQSFGSADPARE